MTESQSQYTVHSTQTHIELTATRDQLITNTLLILIKSSIQIIICIHLLKLIIWYKIVHWSVIGEC